MVQMYKVFYGNRCISLRGFINSNDFFSNDVLIKFKDFEQFRTDLFHNLAQNRRDLVVVSNENSEVLLEHFSSCFKYEKAAGGLVRNKLGEWLFIYRNGHWDLPKGHIEKHEQTSICALREVEEETSVTDLVLLGELIKTYHIYQAEQKWIMKETSWFAMLCQEDDRPRTIPQISEGIQSADWVPPESLPLILGLSFRSIKDELGPIMLENNI
jgi:ADP-ribose pyrophosphatase YjhB (NUDIX family)